MQRTGDQVKSIPITLIHRKNEDQPYKTEVKIQQSPDTSSSTTIACEYCEEDVKVHIRSTRSIRYRYILLLLPSLIIGGYLIYTRTTNQGIETLISSLILYTIIGFIGYLAGMYYLFRSWLTPATVKDSSIHEIID